MVRLTKPGAALPALVTLGRARERLDEQAGDRHRRLAGGLGQDQGGVGRGLAVRRIARRLDRDAAEVEPGRQLPLGLQAADGGDDEVEQLGERVHARSRFSLNRRSCSSSA